MTPRVLSLGDRAFTVEFAPNFDAAARRAVAGLDAAVGAARAAGRLVGVLDTAPTFRSLTVHYDPLVAGRAEIEPEILALAEGLEDAAPEPGALWRFPVAYGGAAGPDLAPLAEECGLTEDEVIAAHSGAPVDVVMLGFLPGFAFMGDIPESIRRPRLTEPRVRVPAGTVAVADRLTAMYPWESPGGWRLIGTCPVPLFDPRRERPALLSPGDRVAFEPVELARAEELAAALASDELDPETFRDATSRDGG